MADPKLSEKWTAGHPLVRIVRKRASDFDVMQLLHLIERIEPGAAPIGHQGPVEHEPLRLRPRLSLGFPPGDIAEVDWYDNPLTLHGQLRITVTYLGLYGSDSPLPTHFTEQLLAEQDDDVRVRDFVDIFHHRIHSLLYRVWKKYRYYVTFRSDGTDPISQVIRGLLGLGTAHLDTQLSVNPVRLFRYAGILAQRPRSAAGLRGQLQDYFEEVPCDIEQCVGRWLTIQPNDRNVMGLGKCTLGEDFLLGERIFDRSGKFRVKLGPVGFDDYTRFLPGRVGRGYPILLRGSFRFRHRAYAARRRGPRNAARRARIPWPIVLDQLAQVRALSGQVGYIRGPGEYVAARAFARLLGTSVAAGADADRRNSDASMRPAQPFGGEMQHGQRRHETLA
jgi:type VI secretion system protein ImpH